jgi:hypothetical protein
VSLVNQWCDGSHPYSLVSSYISDEGSSADAIISRLWRLLAEFELLFGARLRIRDLGENMYPQDPALALVREHILDTLLGALFLFVGLAACLIAALRRRRESRLLVWFGLFIGLYGARILAHIGGDLNLFPRSPWPERLVIAVNYLLVVPAFLFWAERTKSYLRRAFQLLA